MKIEKRFTVEASQDKVWKFITSPEQVAPCIPGCQTVEIVGEGKYKASIKVQVGPIKTTFNVDVETTEERPPEFSAYVTKGEEGSRASRIKAESTLTLRPVNESQTEVEYTSDINVVGRLGKFGLGMMKKKADSMGDEFVTALRSRIEDKPGEGEPVDTTTSLEDKNDYTKLIWWGLGIGVVIIVVLLWLT